MSNYINKIQIGNETKWLSDEYMRGNFNDFIQTGYNPFKNDFENYKETTSTQLSNINSKLDDYSLNSILSPFSKVLTVSKNEGQGGKYHTINEAIQKCVDMGVNDNNPMCIIIFPDNYNEQINLQTTRIDGITLLGLSKSNTRISFDSQSYQENSPISIIGNWTLKNLTVINPSNKVYAMHIDPLDKRIYNFNINVENCNFYGSSGVGIGMERESTVTFRDCYFYGTEQAVYFHNGAGIYGSLKESVPNQYLNFYNCIFSSNNKIALIDDSATSYNNTNPSNLYLTFCNNSYTNSNVINFRRNTYSTDVLHYIPFRDAKNIYINATSKNNNILGFDYNSGEVVIAGTLPMPSNSDTSGKYQTSVFVGSALANYNIDSFSVAIPEVADITSSTSVSKFSDAESNPSYRTLLISTSNQNCAGRTITYAIRLKL